MDKFTNFATGSVVTAPSPATTGTTLVVDNASAFPDPSVDGAYNLCVWDRSNEPNETNTEIVRVTAMTTVGDNATLTVTRAQEGTGVTPDTEGLSIDTGWKVYQSATANWFNSIDSTPTQNSGNLITSGGVFDATLQTATATLTDVGSFYRVANMVFFTPAATFGKDQTIGANTYVVLGDIPAGYTPHFSVAGGLCCLTNSQRANLKANFTSAGKIQLYSGESTSLTTSWILAPAVMWYTTDAWPS